MRAQTFIQEISLDQRVPSFPGVYGAMALASKKGNVNEGMLATSDTQFLKQATPDETIRIGYDGAYYSALAFLIKSNKLWHSRAGSGTLHGGALFFQDNPYPTHTVTANSVVSSLQLYHTTDAEKASAEDLYSMIDTGTRFKVSISDAGTLPAGLAADTIYYAIPFSTANLGIQVAASITDALAGDYVSITDAGSGTITMTFETPESNKGVSQGWDDPADYMLDTSDGRPAGFTSDITLTLTNSELEATADFYAMVATGDKVRMTAVTFPAVDAGDDLAADTDYFIIKSTTDDSVQIARSLADAGNGINIVITTAGDTVVLTLQDKENSGDFTAADATDIITVPATLYAALADNDVVQATTTGTLPAGMATATDYYVTKGSTNEITISATQGGATLDITDTGTGTHTLTISDKNHTSSVTADLSEDLFAVDTQFFSLVQDGDPVKLTSTDTLPSALAEDTTYYVIKTDTSIGLAQSETAQQLGQAIDVKDAGTGTHTIHLTSNEVLYGFDMPAVLYAGKDPGNWNNDIFLVSTHYPYGDSATWSTAQSDAADLVKYPNCYHLGVYKKDADGNYELVEDFILSRTEGYKDGSGTNIFVEDRLESSDYIRAYNNAAVPETIMPADQATMLMMTSGDDGDTVTDTEMINAFETFRSTRDKQVTLLMDGGWATPAYAKQSLISVAEGRKDCFALLSCPVANEMASDPLTEVIRYRKETLNANTSYAALYSPHLQIRDRFNARDLIVAPDGYVGANISEQSAVAEFWLPPAGERRGQLNVVDTLYHWSEGEMDALYNVQVNPIDFYPGRGIFVSGQKTLLSIPSALDRINCRLVLIVVQPALKRFLDTFLFEYNDATTRKAVYNGIDAAMKRYKARGAFYGYTIQCDEKNNTGAVIDANELWVDLYVQLTKAAEYIYLRTIITPTNSTITLG